MHHCTVCYIRAIINLFSLLVLRKHMVMWRTDGNSECVLGVKILSGSWTTSILTFKSQRTGLECLAWWEDANFLCLHAQLCNSRAPEVKMPLSTAVSFFFGSKFKIQGKKIVTWWNEFTSFTINKTSGKV